MQVPPLTPEPSGDYCRRLSAHLPDGNHAQFVQGKTPNTNHVTPWFRMEFTDVPGRQVHVQMAKAATEQHDALMATLVDQANSLRSLLARWQEVDMRIALDGFPPDSSDRRNAGKKASGNVEVLLHLRTTLELHEGYDHNPEVAGIVEEVRSAMERCKHLQAPAPAKSVRSSTLGAHLVASEG